MDGEEIAAAVSALRAASVREPYPELTTRMGWLNALEKAVEGRGAELAKACDEDFGGRSIFESQLGELWLSLAQLRYVRRQLKGWAKPRSVPVPPALLMGKAYVLPQPKGVVAIIAPWNYPVMLALAPLVGALAAGNRVVLKLSERTQRTSRLLAQLIEDALPSDVVRVFFGGREQGEALCSQPLDHLLFTGGNATGLRVYQQAAARMTPVTLELGGKSPAVLHPSYSVGRFADRVLQGKCFNGGQSCVAPDYLLVPRVMMDAVAAALRSVFAVRFPSLKDNPDYTGLLGEDARKRIDGLVAEAVELGARAVELNPLGEDLSQCSKRPLTLLLDVPEEARVLQEEIFGPILPILGYDRIEDVPAFLAQRPRPLALYYFDEEPSRARWMLRMTTSGGATLNDTLLHFLCDALPRNTVGHSGIGGYQGQQGFDTFSNLKSVFSQSSLSGVGLLSPPYTERSARLIRWLTRFG